MVEVILILISIILAVAVGFLIPVLIELKISARETVKFLKTNEQALNSALQELSETMKSIRGITENLSSLTGDAREVTHSVAELGRHLEETGRAVEEVTSRVSVSVSSLRAGVLTALDVLIHNLLRKGGQK